jgi:hypothetical protein
MHSESSRRNDRDINFLPRDHSRKSHHSWLSQDSAAIPQRLEPYFKTAARNTFVLRRYQVLQFINSRDGERYQQISQLIGLSALDTIDRNWRREWLDAKKRVDELRAVRKEICTRLGELLDQPVRYCASRAQITPASIPHPSVSSVPINKLSVSNPNPPLQRHLIYSRIHINIHT